MDLAVRWHFRLRHDVIKDKLIQTITSKLEVLMSDQDLSVADYVFKLLENVRYFQLDMACSEMQERVFFLLKSQEPKNTKFCKK